MNEKLIVYRGVRMIAEWPERIRQAQLETTCRPNRIELPRVRYGDEQEDWGARERPCGDCFVVRGEYHVPGCDVERCPDCGGQLWFGCECESPIQN